ENPSARHSYLIAVLAARRSVNDFYFFQITGEWLRVDRLALRISRCYVANLGISYVKRDPSQKESA
ncbi:hypothetical protein EMPG_13706, partial [Blastomyces silverae]